MKAHESADMNTKTVQASGLLGHFSKSDIRYWQQTIFRQAYTRNGKTLLTKDWAMKIAHEGRRTSRPQRPERVHGDPVFIEFLGDGCGRLTWSVTNHGGPKLQGGVLSKG